MWSPPRWRKTEVEASGDGKAFNSLFGEILDWMLAPLLFLWPISIIVTHNVANSIANQPYDQALAVNVRAIARLVKVEGNLARVNFPAPARLILRADEDDTVYYQVLGFKGELLAGDKDIPTTTPPDSVEPDLVLYRDEQIAGEYVRVAYQFLQPV